MSSSSPSSPVTTSDQCKEGWVGWPVTEATPLHEDSTSDLLVSAAQLVESCWGKASSSNHCCRRGRILADTGPYPVPKHGLFKGSHCQIDRITTDMTTTDTAEKETPTHTYTHKCMFTLVGLLHAGFYIHRINMIGPCRSFRSM